jgi:host factor-I protein
MITSNVNDKFGDEAQRKNNFRKDPKVQNLWNEGELPQSQITEIDEVNQDRRYLEYSYINNLCKNKIQVSIYLKSGIQLRGSVAMQDKYTLLLAGKTKQLVYKQAISTIVAHLEDEETL